MALELKRLMKGNDVIYFQTMHNLARPYMLKVRALNQAVREVTKEHNLKLLDVEELLGSTLQHTSIVFFVIFIFGLCLMNA